MKIGSKIRIFREQRNLSANKLAKTAKISQSFLSQIERDISSPSLDTLEKICNALNVPIIQILQFGEKDQTTALSPDMKDLVDNLHLLSQDEIAALNEFIKAILLKKGRQK
ncbi:transcriptional regulator with XRE-family HTH domain [Brevibacillus aydinogluensis]|jgi:transcriptional regulator with XRE-family HTH domain|uniref:helix-turn-helix domain-containing protein n=1 Tax=Brevibacillus aydinogluensis TaxID=927786 RepID=UPI0028930B48|nr:helix-turn-helix transcriptional regulator [Brevibacillus aydinogluensis]MDT3418255.1 transcriptional regulator with XRE-family HTH domain [Brevibacillus aydinogluensis]